MKWRLLILLTLTASYTFSNDNFIAGVFSNPINRYFDMDIEANNKNVQIEEQFIKDIIEVVSGMVYGWKFTYVPSDIARKIDEVFILEPITLIKRGDHNMRFKDNWVKDYIMYQNVVYYLEDFQKKRIQSWNSSVIPKSTGEGEHSMYEDNAKSLSLKNALKDSIKKEFQSRGKGKPRSIEKQILLEDIPRTFINSNAFKTQVDVLLIYKDIMEYKYH